MKEKIEQVNQILESKGVTIESIQWSFGNRELPPDGKWAQFEPTNERTITINYTVADD